MKSKNIQIERVPEHCDAEAWLKFNERLNDLADQGYKVSFTAETYILLERKAVATRREE
jgi:hypothetical protein